jgi:hypothetical protein
VPVVQVTSSTPVVIGKGTSYDVGFHIAKWIDRPAKDDAPVVQDPVQAAPEPAPAPAASAGGGSDFGF